jgi:hypothetical protein
VLALAAGLLAFGGAAKADFRMTCESISGKYRFCAVDTFRGVILEQQLSNAACIQGGTWGYSRSGIWVTFGCRGVFRIETNGGGGHHGDNDGDRIKDIVADGILRDLVDKDARDGRQRPYGRADALRMCVRYAQDYELNRGAKSIFVRQVSVDARGQRSYAVRFNFEAKYKQKPKTRYYSAECGVKNGEVQSYGRD